MPTSDTSHKSKFLLLIPAAAVHGGAQTPSVGWILLLARLTELRETSYSLGTADGEGARARYVGNRVSKASMPPPGASVFPDLCVVTNPRAPHMLSFWVFTRASFNQPRLIKSLATGRWTQAPAPPLLPGAGGWGGSAPKVPTLYPLL